MKIFIRHIAFCLIDSKPRSVGLHWYGRPKPVILGLSVLALTLFLALTWGSPAQAGGFNVDSLVTLTPLASTYRTVTNTTGCPAGFVGKFTFTAQLTNKPDSPAMPGLDVFVQELSNGNVLLDPQTNARLGGAGAVMEIPRVGQYADGLLSANETVDVPFVVCLKTRQAFQFFVDVFGIVTEFVSINRTGTGSGNGAAGRPAISADGRFVAFDSNATNLVAIQTGGAVVGTDVFVRDLQTEVTTLVSVNRAGTHGGNGRSGDPAISADGRFVAFASTAIDLVAIPGGGENVFVRDLKTGTTTIASVNQAETSGGNGRSHSPVLSADGRFVAFKSEASDLAATDTNGTTDVFVRDLQTGVTTLASINQAGTDSGNGNSGDIPFNPDFVLSADGRFVSFESTATDLVAIPTSGRGDVFVRDLQMGVTTLASVNREGTHGGNGHVGSSFPTISADGRFVSFASTATDLVAIPTSGSGNVFVRDLKTGTTMLVSVNRLRTASGNDMSFFPTISANGRFVAFASAATDLVAINNDHWGVFVRDLQKGVTTVVSLNHAGTGSGNDGSYIDGISADGRFVAFRSNASDLVATDTNGQADLFVRDLQTATTTLVSVNRAGTDSGNSFLGQELFISVSLSADGRFVAFASWASDLVAPDTNGTVDVFVRPVQ